MILPPNMPGGFAVRVSYFSHGPEASLTASPADKKTAIHGIAFLSYPVVLQGRPRDAKRDGVKRVTCVLHGRITRAVLCLVRCGEASIFLLLICEPKQQEHSACGRPLAHHDMEHDVQGGVVRSITVSTAICRKRKPCQH